MNMMVVASLALMLVFAVIALVHQMRLRGHWKNYCVCFFHDGETMKTISSTAVTILACPAVVKAGCSDSTEVARVATEAADRQARQNEQMARVTSQFAEGSRQLVEADSAARKEIVGVHRDLQAERKTLSEQWNSLEGERQSIAQDRRTESMLVPVAQAVGGLLLAVVVIGFSWSLLFGLRKTDGSDTELNELLVQEFAAEQPRLLPMQNARILTNTENGSSGSGPGLLTAKDNDSEDQSE